MPSKYEIERAVRIANSGFTHVQRKAAIELNRIIGALRQELDCDIALVAPDANRIHAGLDIGISFDTIGTAKAAVQFDVKPGMTYTFNLRFEKSAKSGKDWMLGWAMSNGRTSDDETTDYWSEGEDDFLSIARRITRAALPTDY